MGGRITNLGLISVSLLLVITLTAPSLGQTNSTDLNASQWFGVGLSLFNQNRFEESNQAFDKATDIYPQFAEAWNFKGIDLGSMGKYEDSRQALERAVAINSSYAQAWYNLGVVCDSLGDYNSAVRAYNMATEINPNNQDAWFRKNQDIDIIGIGHTSLYNELTGRT